MNVIEVRNLVKTYKNDRGIKGIDLSIGEGEVFGLFGPNGAGKTTLMKCMTGQCQMDEGSASLFGWDITTHYEMAMSQTGCLIGPPFAYDEMTARENMQLVARYYPQIDAKRIDEVLQVTGLAQNKHEKVASFSAGMKQRLSLAFALYPNPKLLILDEPTNGMDIEGKLLFREIVDHLANNEGVSFLISSHLIHELEPVCKSFGMIDDGKWISTGKIAEIKEQSLEQHYKESVVTGKKGV
ncbi:ABC transporter ATP-binding protein [Brevibacillus sp. SYSU BS000544]|uniref:ABC transporter ATP-binding protein n=1 Tax=Brevibacillus sp. SYSU BS000544 TaxID=3416443 RepID=UPI003CE5087B